MRLSNQYRFRVLFRSVLGLLGVVMTPTGVHGQCEPEWLPGVAGAGVWGDVNCLGRFDPDGDGPAKEMVILGGEFLSVGALGSSRVAGWDGLRWHAFGDELVRRGNKVLAVQSFDPDGAGPELPQLIAGGAFIDLAQTPRSQVARWDGQEWLPIGGDLGPQVQALTVFDLDGPGPNAPQLIAGGMLYKSSTSGAVVVSWDGQSWNQLGSIGGTSIRDLLVFDPDGSGPQPEMLLAAGHWNDGVIAWNGVSWEGLGTRGPTVQQYALTAWDPDGAGPLGEHLISVGGDGVVWAWDGQQWASMGSPGLTSTLALDVVRETANAPAVLVVSGNGGVFRWDGTIWIRVAEQLNRNVNALLTIDWDGEGVDKLLIGGAFHLSSGGSRCDFFGELHNDHWIEVARGFNNVVSAMALHDDGQTGSSKSLVVGGNFNLNDRNTMSRIAMWDGDMWSALGSGVDGFVTVLLSHDFDGPGGNPSRLVAGGGFTTAGGMPAAGVASWDGVDWSQLGSGLEGTVHALTEFDFDGAGPEPASLVAGGYRLYAAHLGNASVVRFAGRNWTEIGTVFGDAEALTSIDFDGDGPELPTLIAGGSFWMNDSKVAKWDGVAWQPMGEGLNYGVKSLLAWDRDGAGGMPPQLVAGGSFTSSGGVGENNVALWNGDSWQGLAGGMDGYVNGLSSFDPDGDGPLPADLIAVGLFTTAGGVPANNIARWDGTNWHAMDEGLSRTGEVVLQIDETGPADMNLNLLVGGAFEFAGGLPSAYFAQYGCQRCPADCDQSTGVGVLDIFDFLCFQNSFVAGDPYACDCDTSTGTSPSVCDVFDFLCFQNAFVAGCP